MQSDIRIIEIEPHFTAEKAITPFMFGSSIMEAATLCHVRARVENRAGRVADGWGAIFLSHMWAYPTDAVKPATKDWVMRRVVEEAARRLSEQTEFGHPVDLFMQFERELGALNEAVCAAMKIEDTMPYLGALVCAAPIDAALHDAFGVVNGISAYDGYGPEHMTYDLSAYLGDEFAGRYISDFLSPAFAKTVPIFHTVSGLDKLSKTEETQHGRQNQHPGSLERWIRREGVYCFKIKLSGNDLYGDIRRVLDVFQLARAVHTRRDDIYLSTDANEQSDYPDYMIEVLNKVREKSAEAFKAVLYVEQPTERDLTLHRFDMRPLSKLKPVVVDESLTGLDTFDLALELGWSGVALKTCKCHSMELLLMARAKHLGIIVTAQDLTNPGIALLHSVGFAARINPLKGVEANSRQFFPNASDPEAAVHPGIVQIEGGVARTDSLQGPGLGYRVGEIARSVFAQG